jgi:hypothetical protein
MMSGYLGSYFIQQDYVFMNKIITQFKQVLGIVPGGKYGAGTSFDFNYAGSALSTDKIDLSINGLIAYLYSSVYGTTIPDIFTVPPAATTQLEKDQIYTVYDALNIPRPSL